MRLKVVAAGMLLAWFAACSAASLRAQSVNGSLSGTVTDPAAAVTPNAVVTLTSEETGVAKTCTVGIDGLYTFPNVPTGTYDLRVAAKGFRDYVQKGITVRVGANVRQDVALEIGLATEVLEVRANASPLNFENAERKEGVNPETIKQLPLLVAGSIRSSAAFVTLLPGVTQGSSDTTSVHMNGAQQYAGEAILDGISLVNPSGGNGIFSAFSDFPQSPDMIGELQVLSSNYLPQYGTSAGAAIIMSIRSGTDSFHGNVFEFNRNTSFNARQFGTADRSKDIENEFGGNVGGPMKLPFLWGGNHRTYFFSNFEDFKVAGALNRQTISIPSLKERQGDFSDWVDPATGNLIPVFDPDTLHANPNFDASQAVGPNNLPYLRDQFMGCNGQTPNVICASDPRLQNSLAQQWFKFLPDPTSPGPLNNYLAPPVPAGFLNSSAWAYTLKIDEYLGTKDHISGSVYYKRVLPTTFTHLPPQISTDGLSFKRTWVERINWDRTISPSVLNHFGAGYNDDKFYGGGIDGPYAVQLPEIPGVANHGFPPQIILGDGFNSLGSGSGFVEPWPAPAYVANDMLTWVRGKQTLTLGSEYRNLGNSYHFIGGESGSFAFADGETGLLGLGNSGNSIASFLLGQVDSGSGTFRSTHDIYGRDDTFAAFAGDTWKMNSKLTVAVGVRWEMDRPPVEKWNRFSFFDPNASNPGADGRPGALVFAGFGAGKYGDRHPEKTFHKAFAPRLGFAYAVSPTTVVRAGYGIFYDMANMPGWDSGIGQDGFNTTATFSSTIGGLSRAFLLNSGLPQNFQRPPFLDPSFDNGQGGPIYRPLEANRLPYSQQWNLTVEREFKNNFMISAGYVANKGTRLLSHEAAINALNPKYLSMGQALNDEFQPGQTTLDGVTVPFTNFAQTMQACSPSVAQALLPYPQYCSGLFGRDENAGNSTYHSFQFKLEHRFSGGLWLLGSYTLSKLITDSDNNQAGAYGIGQEGVFSPFNRRLNKSLALEDVPQAMAISLSYDLPFGRGKRWLQAGGAADKVVGGWTLSSIFKAQSGIPFHLYSSSCTVPGPLQATCLPGLLPGKSPFLQHGSINLNLPLLDANAFEPPSSFNFYSGQGPRVDGFRQPGFTGHDVALEKVIPLGERFGIHIRAEAFNAWNWHHFNGVGVPTGGLSSQAFDTDVASPGFGTWTRLVTNPRNIQVAARLTF